MVSVTPMKLLTWNCQMAFRRKYREVACYGADVLVIPESESPAFLAGKGAKLPYTSHI